MTKINNKLYDYYTQPENFNSIAEIYNDFPLVRKQLIEEFWTGVNAEVEKLINAADWLIEFADEFEDEYIEIALALRKTFKKDAEPSIWLMYIDCYKSSYLKLYYSKGFDFNYKQVSGLFEDYKQQGWRVTKSLNSEVGVLWKYSELDFSMLKSLEYILPSNRIDMMKRFAQTIIDSAISLKPLMEAIIANKK